MQKCQKYARWWSVLGCYWGTISLAILDSSIQPGKYRELCNALSLCFCLCLSVSVCFPVCLCLSVCLPLCNKVLSYLSPSLSLCNEVLSLSLSLSLSYVFIYLTRKGIMLLSMFEVSEGNSFLLLLLSFSFVVYKQLLMGIVYYNPLVVKAHNVLDLVHQNERVTHCCSKI